MRRRKLATVYYWQASSPLKSSPQEDTHRTMKKPSLLSGLHEVCTGLEHVPTEKPSIDPWFYHQNDSSVCHPTLKQNLTRRPEEGPVAIPIHQYLNLLLCLCLYLSLYILIYIFLYICMHLYLYSKLHHLQPCSEAPSAQPCPGWSWKEPG